MSSNVRSCVPWRPHRSVLEREDFYEFNIYNGGAGPDQQMKPVVDASTKAAIIANNAIHKMIGGN